MPTGCPAVSVRRTRTQGDSRRQVRFCRTRSRQQDDNPRSLKEKIPAEQVREKAKK